MDHPLDVLFRTGLPRRTRRGGKAFDGPALCPLAQSIRVTPLVALTPPSRAQDFSAAIASLASLAFQRRAA